MLISIINGPNINLLGKRETDIYGGMSWDVFEKKLQERFSDVELVFFQSNIEGEIVTALQEHGFSATGIILNPAAYTHTSVAIGDAIAAITTPVVEVHISNIFDREDFRKFSYVSAKAAGVISGLGLDGYRLAVEYFLGAK